MMIELAIRMRNKNIDESTFLMAKTKAVQALVSVHGVSVLSVNLSRF